MVQTYSRGNDFATTKIFDEKFWINPTPEEMILQPYKIFDQKISMKNFGSNLFPRK